MPRMGQSYFPPREDSSLNRSVYHTPANFGGRIFL